ncbi:hypothetical protein FQA47_003038 [Oryzias melastigma]|uniref:Uncharacterized protein n=1 Tax=Oryzias melastigma TaxID=30732 RepID=A0A834FG38_ORYME|nr:hypothetical protein FQA47_003038 [Oryzias melastigma]
MFELIHFCTYKERFISLYCRLSSVLDLDSLITQQALREAITDSEVTTAKNRHQLILDYIQTDSPSSTMNLLPTPSPSPSPEHRRRKAISDSQHGSDEDGSSEVFLPTDSDYDSSDALSPRDQDLLCSPELSHQAGFMLGGSAPDVLQIQELRFSNDLPMSLPLSASLSDTTKTLESLSLSKEGTASVGRHTNPPTKRKLLSRSHRSQYFSGPQRWLRGNSGESLTGSLSEGIYTKQTEPDLPLSGDPPSPQGPTYISHVSCILENHKSPQKEPRPLVHRICVEPCWEKRSKNELVDTVVAAGVSVVVGQVESEGKGAKAEEVATQEMDSDDQTNSQMSEILSSML